MTLVPSLKSTFLIISLLHLQSCATLSEDECRVADWNAIGFEDGSVGRHANYFGNHREACSEYGIRANFNLYQSGREKGIRSYCNTDNGYTLGVNGGQYKGVCPEDLEDRFLLGYNHGREVYLVKQDIKKIQSKISKARTDLDNMNKDLKTKETKLISDGIDSKTRADLLYKLLNIKSSVKEKEYEIDGLEYEKERLNQKLLEKQI